MFNTWLHTCGILFVVYGGFGFQTVEIYARFGADTATFFFKVSTEAFRVDLSQLIKYMTGRHVFRAPVERHCLLQQAVHLIHVHDTNTQSIDEYVGASYWRPHNSLEYRGYNWRRHDLPAISKKLGVRHTWNLWKSSGLLLCHGRYQYHHRHNHDSITNALSLSAATRVSKETIRNDHAKHWYDVSCSLSFTSLNQQRFSTWIITIYRQTLLSDLDYADLTHNGVLATVLSGLEPAIAIALACIATASL